MLSVRRWSLSLSLFFSLYLSLSHINNSGARRTHAHTQTELPGSRYDFRRRCLCVSCRSRSLGRTRDSGLAAASPTSDNNKQKLKKKNIVRRKWEEKRTEQNRTEGVKHREFHRRFVFKKREEEEEETRENTERRNSFRFKSLLESSWRKTSTSVHLREKKNTRKTPPSFFTSSRGFCPFFSQTARNRAKKVRRSAPRCWRSVFSSVPPGWWWVRPRLRTRRNPSSWRGSVWWCVTPTRPRTPRAPHSASPCAPAARRWRFPQSGTPTMSRQRWATEPWLSTSTG